MEVYPVGDVSIPQPASVFPQLARSEVSTASSFLGICSSVAQHPNIPDQSVSAVHTKLPDQSDLSELTHQVVGLDHFTQDKPDGADHTPAEIPPQSSTQDASGSRGLASLPP